MKTPDDLITQLNEQQIVFQLWQSGNGAADSPELEEVVRSWKNTFIGQRTAPHLEDFLWHIYSYELADALSGAAATEAFQNQPDTDTFIFNESRQFLLQCQDIIPIFTFPKSYFDDLYIVSSGMEWTYVIPHEVPRLGPYFSVGN